MQVNTQKKWRAILKQQAQSTLTIEQFCTQLKISPSSFYQRKRELTTLEQQESSFIQASITQTVELATQASTIRLTVGKAKVTLSSQISASYLATLINELHS